MENQEDSIRYSERGAVLRLVTEFLMKGKHEYNWKCKCLYCESVRDVIKFVSSGLDLLDDERHAPPDFSEEEKHASGSLTVGDIQGYFDRGAPGLIVTDSDKERRDKINERGN